MHYFINSRCCFGTTPLLFYPISLIFMASLEPVNLQEYADAAKQKLAKNAYDYYRYNSHGIKTAAMLVLCSGLAV